MTLLDGVVSPRGALYHTTYIPKSMLKQCNTASQSATLYTYRVALHDAQSNTLRSVAHSWILWPHLFHDATWFACNCPALDDATPGGFTSKDTHTHSVFHDCVYVCREIVCSRAAFPYTPRPHKRRLYMYRLETATPRTHKNPLEETNRALCCWCVPHHRGCVFAIPVDAKYPRAEEGTCWI